MECLGRLLHCIYLDKNLALVKDLSELSTLKELACNVINDLILTGIFADRKLEVSHVLIVYVVYVWESVQVVVVPRPMTGIILMQSNLFSW